MGLAGSGSSWQRGMVIWQVGGVLPAAGRTYLVLIRRQSGSGVLLITTVGGMIRCVGNAGGHVSH